MGSDNFGVNWLRVGYSLYCNKVGVLWRGGGEGVKAVLIGCILAR